MEKGNPERAQSTQFKRNKLLKKVKKECKLQYQLGYEQESCDSVDGRGMRDNNGQGTRDDYDDEEQSPTKIIEEKSGRTSPKAGFQIGSDPA